jgi:hypothetical protein
MDAVEANKSDDIQAQVLQTTLAEIEISRQTAPDSTSTDDDAEPRDCCVICLGAISDPCTALPCSRMSSLPSSSHFQNDTVRHSDYSVDC